MEPKTKIWAYLQLASHNKATGDTLYTFKLTFPRIILAEVLTHRVFSRNTASSRAIPTKKLRKRVMQDPFVPMFVGKNQKGMQAGDSLDTTSSATVRKLWRWARIPACFAHWCLEKIGVHKQIANRLIEPWMWVEQVCSMTELDNFLKQRAHPAAEPHLQALAYYIQFIKDNVDSLIRMMREEDVDVVDPDTLRNFGFGLLINKVQVLNPGEWHLPFAEDYDVTEPINSVGRVTSAARCARVSYYLMDGKESTWEEDNKLYEKLAGADPKHLSPLEHPAAASMESGWAGNYMGFKQLRAFVENDNA